jgi:hypothetical protein
MPFGYIGQNQPNQKVKNAGVISSFEISHLDYLDQVGGVLEHIQTADFTDYNETVNFTNVKESHYNIHFLTISNLHGNSSTAQDVGIRVSNDGGSTFESGTHKYGTQGVSSGGTVGTVRSEDNNRFMFAPDLDSESNASVNGHAWIYNLGSSTRYTMTATRCSISQSSHPGRMRDGGSFFNTLEAHNAIQVMSSSNGGFSKGTIKLYGLRE